MIKPHNEPLKGVSILGSTGSIGTNTLKVIERFDERFRVIGLAAGKRIPNLKAQINQFRPALVSVANEEAALELQSQHPNVRVLTGVEGMVEVATQPESDFLISATVGAVGLVPTMRGIEAGKTVGLANKEALVMAGEMMIRAAKTSGTELLPVDSEHNAIHQCLAGRDHPVKRIWLTASGGPFRQASFSTMRDAKPVEALKHPTWRMGPKISIDSATMMNKGLEVIEACWLFGLKPAQVRIVIHPQSTIHSMVEFEDGSLIAQLGITDMRAPIQYALTYPERLDTALPPLDLGTPLSLDLHPPDTERFRCLPLAYQAMEEGGTAPAVLNAANEVAVSAYLAERIGFLQIPDILSETLNRHDKKPASDLDTVLAADAWARKEAEQVIAAATTIA